jgi:hypothetical protein
MDYVFLCAVLIIGLGNMTVSWLTGGCSFGCIADCGAQRGADCVLAFCGMLSREESPFMCTVLGLFVIVALLQRIGIIGQK